jgi:hypothetical protein
MIGPRPWRRNLEIGSWNGSDWIGFARALFLELPVSSVCSVVSNSGYSNHAAAGHDTRKD